ncbi:helix-turn-helix domain-containing protein [Deinococcus aerius]|nr:helix-turn-helix transcriptional regulator [Deinococcus aerius]
MVRWKLQGTMDAHNITRYALQKESGVAMNTLRAMYEGSTQRPDLEVLDLIIKALRKITGKDLGLLDVLEWAQDG